MFRSEDTLYEMDQTCNYEYNYEAFVEFYDPLRYGSTMLDMYRLSLIERVVYSWRVDKDRRECLTAFLGKLQGVVIIVDRSKVGQPYSVFILF